MKNRYLNLAIFGFTVALITVPFSFANQAPNGARKTASSDSLKVQLAACEKVGDIAGQIDCYWGVVDSSAAEYRNSKYSKVGSAKKFKASLRGAKSMCELGSNFIPPAMSGSDQCLLNASKVVATYLVGVLSDQNSDPEPFAPEINNN